MKHSKFSDVVCSSREVQLAFATCRTARVWWKCVLWLHGKPIQPRMPDAERRICIANGFGFYALLYRTLSVVFVALSLVLLSVNLMFVPTISVYWIAACALAAGYLWLASGLGYAGAGEYRRGDPCSFSSLIAFMVMMVAFLSMFVAGVSMAAHEGGWLTTWQNLLCATALFAFGIGSYMIEVVYLATDGRIPEGTL